MQFALRYGRRQSIATTHRHPDQQPWLVDLGWSGQPLCLDRRRRTLRPRCDASTILGLELKANDWRQIVPRPPNPNGILLGVRNCRSSPRALCSHEVRRPVSPVACFKSSKSKNPPQSPASRGFVVCGSHMHAVRFSTNWGHVWWRKTRSAGVTAGRALTMQLTNAKCKQAACCRPAARSPDRRKGHVPGSPQSVCSRPMNSVRKPSIAEKFGMRA